MYSSIVVHILPHFICFCYIGISMIQNPKMLQVTTSSSKLHGFFNFYNSITKYQLKSFKIWIMIITFSLPIKEILFLLPYYWFFFIKKKSASLRHNLSTAPEINLFNHIKPEILARHRISNQTWLAKGCSHFGVG